MRESLHATHSPSPGQKSEKSCPLKPGKALGAEIAAVANRGRPVWDLGQQTESSTTRLLVPRLALVPAGDHFQIKMGSKADGVLRHRLAIALETRYPAAIRELGETDRTEARKLAAAGLHDVWAVDYTKIASIWGYAYDFSNRRIREAVRAGRRLFVGLDAWPWCCWPNGVPPHDWPKHGGWPRLDVSFQLWADG